MDRLAEITAFVKVVQIGSFAAAARQMNVSSTIVSRHVRQLEEWLGVRLLDRTTRYVALTEIGQVVLERCADLLAEFNELESTAGNWRGVPKGTLRVSAPLSFGGGPLAAKLPEFLTLYPYINIDLTLTDRYVDVVEEGLDVAIAVGELPNSSAVARVLCRLQSGIYASHAYLAAHGRPIQADDLLTHECLLHTAFGTGWTVIDAEAKTHRLKVSGRLKTNSASAMVTALLAGQGIALVPEYLVSEAVASGKLERLLTDCSAPDIPVRVIYRPSRHSATKISVFVNFLAAAFR